MKTKLFITTLIGACLLVTSCVRNTPGDASLIEGGWDLQTADFDKMVYADLNGNTHLKDSAYTRTFKQKEQVWIFYEKAIGEWQYFEQNGEGLWTSYKCDCYRNYTVEGEGSTLTIVETGGSTIPGMEDLTYTTRYKVEKLTKSAMVLSFTDQVYVSDTQSTVDLHVVYTFRREDSLLEYILSVYP